MIELLSIILIKVIFKHTWTDICEWNVENNLNIVAEKSMQT